MNQRQSIGMSALLLCASVSLHAVQIINVTPVPVYYSVFYKKQGKARKQIKPIYTAEPNGDYFLARPTFDLKDPALKISTFKWPPQKCVEFTDEELIALGVGVGVPVVAATVAGGAVAGGTIGGAAVGAGGFGVPGGVATGLAAGGGAGAAVGGGAVGGALGAVASGDVCKAEHYPRTVLFSFFAKDIEAPVHDWKNPQGTLSAMPDAPPARSAQAYVEKMGSSLHRGDNVDGGETHFVFYNPYGFDAHYAAYGRFEKNEVAKAGKLNSTQVDPLIPDVLRNYLRFANYFYIGRM